MRKKDKDMREDLRNLSMSVGNLNNGKQMPVNPYGKKTMRGYGAARKGRQTSGKMG